MSGLDVKSRETSWRWIWVVTFAAAFAWVEMAVVLYLHEICFSGSLSFPLPLAWKNGELVVNHLMRVEFGREIAAFLILAAVACTAGRNLWQKFAFFLIAFGVWDIFFYIWMRLGAGWPENLLTWNILYALPLPWVAPVLAPLLIAFAMAAAGGLILYFENKGHEIRWRWFDWIIMFGCASLMLAAFWWDWKNIIRVPADPPNTGIPNPFAWWLYLPAYIFSVGYFAFRMRQNVKHWKANQA